MMKATATPNNEPVNSNKKPRSDLHSSLEYNPGCKCYRTIPPKISSVIIMDTPSLRLLMDFGVWFSWWIFWWIFFVDFSGMEEQAGTYKKLKIHPKWAQGEFCLEFELISEMFPPEKYRCNAAATAICLVDKKCM